MAQSLAAKKTDFAVQIVAIAEAILEKAMDWDELNAHYFANAFNSGAANQFTQADLDVSGSTTHMTPAIVADVITVIQALQTALTQGHKDNLRKARGDVL